MRLLASFAFFAFFVFCLPTGLASAGNRYEWLEGYQDIHAGEEHALRFFHKHLDKDGSMVLVFERVDASLTPTQGAALLLGVGIPDGVMPSPEHRFRLVDRQTRKEWRFTMGTYASQQPPIGVPSSSVKELSLVH